ncbi:unnamed protein product [Echinostoma caproni]|uniref:Cation_ATPase_N domain-containing protein n=1 Tax=Echinostoma caproni TaxID=27848 RepID=A0A183B0N9_9TREM|nr:unnamed protein product [Echinostoma caproni]
MVNQTEPGIINIRRADGTLVDGNTGAASTLAEYYSTLFIPENVNRTDGSGLPAKDPISSRFMEFVSFSLAQVGLTLVGIAVQTSPRLDEIPPIVL